MDSTVPAQAPYAIDISDKKKTSTDKSQQKIHFALFSHNVFHLRDYILIATTTTHFVTT
jgi:hypothetical protein